MGLSITVGQDETGDIKNIGSLGAGGRGKKENGIKQICLYPLPYLITNPLSINYKQFMI